MVMVMVMVMAIRRLVSLGLCRGQPHPLSIRSVWLIFEFKYGMLDGDIF